MLCSAGLPGPGGLAGARGTRDPRTLRHTPPARLRPSPCPRPRRTSPGRRTPVPPALPRVPHYRESKGVRHGRGGVTRHRPGRGEEMGGAGPAGREQSGGLPAAASKRAPCVPGPRCTPAAGTGVFEVSVSGEGVSVRDRVSSPTRTASCGVGEGICCGGAHSGGGGGSARSPVTDPLQRRLPRRCPTRDTNWAGAAPGVGTSLPPPPPPPAHRPLPWPLDSTPPLVTSCPGDVTARSGDVTL